jgi:hypothetical protein
MAIVILILQIILALPQLFQTVMEILALIRRQPRPARGALYAKLLDMVERGKAAGFVSADLAKELEDFVQKLREGISQ